MPSSIAALLAGSGTISRAAPSAVAHLFGIGRVNLSAPTAVALLSGKASFGQSSSIVASLSSAGTISKSKSKGRTSLTASVAGNGMLSYGFPYGTWFAKGRGSLNGTVRATGSIAASLAGAGRLSDILHGQWYAQGRGSLAATITARLRDSYKHQIVRRYTKGLTQLASVLETQSGNVELKFEQTIPPGTSNLPLGISFNSSSLVMLGIMSDEAVTLKTNSPTSPTQTISISALVWSVLSPQGAPFSGVVSEIYLSNSNSVAAEFSLAALLEE